MGSIIFANTRHKYDSYTDYHRLVGLSGFETCFIDEINYDSDNLYIVSPINGEVAAIRKERHCAVYGWNLERPSGSGSLTQYKRDNDKLLDDGTFDAILVSDKELALVTGLSYMPLGSHALLGVPGLFDNKSIDFIPLACYSNHRGWMFKEPGVLHTQIDHMTIAANAWGDQRHAALLQAKYMLNIHQDNFTFIEPLRFALAASYGLTVVSEQITHQPFPYGDLIVHTKGMVDIRELMAEMVDEYYTGDWYDLGLQFREVMTGEYNFRKLVEANI